jgi:molybdopterin synthase sulfur carrier subunit
MNILYFAWVRERIGLPREKVDTSARTVLDLVEELRGREERYAVAFSDLPLWKGCAKWRFSRR